ncbi:MAG: SRPBCC family protein [Nocardioidaceae bacterium]
MTTKVEKSITVDVPISMAYNQWTQFEDFPEFMGGVQQVEQLDDQRLHWVAEIGGVKREWHATILEQRPDEKVAWAATEGATNAGAVYFSEVGPGQTMVTLELEYEPEGVVEKAGDALNIVERQARADLDKFKAFIESRNLETGAWRGEVEGTTLGSPGVESATSQGDSGKAGISGKAAVAGVAAAAAGAAAVAAARSGSKDTETEVEAVEVPAVPEVEVVEEVTVVPAGTEGVVEDYPGTAAPVGDPVVPGDTELDSDLPGVTDHNDGDPRTGGTGGTGV